MPILGHPNLMMLAADGRGSPTIMKYEEMKSYLAKHPANKIHFADEEGHFQNDTITIGGVTSSSQDVCDALLEAWIQLRTIMGRNASTLNKRWLKKTFDQRKDILVKVCPGIPRMHRPDFVVLRNEDRPNRKTKIAADFALRFPHINLEDLSQARPLLWMLDSRSRSFPSCFTNADRDSIRVGLRSKLLVPKYMRGYAMYLNGEWSREAYGRLLSWMEDRQAILKCYQGIALNPGMRLLILKIQRDVLQFLVRISMAILHDIPALDFVKSPLSISSCTAVPETLAREEESFCLKSRTNEHELLRGNILEAPYRTPDVFNYTRFKSLAEAKCQEAQDHLLLLHEDPGFFAEMIHEGCGHTVEAILNPQYNPRFTFLTDAAWDEAISRVLMQAYHDVFMWRCVSQLLDELIITWTEQRSHIKLGEALPELYWKIFSRLGYLIECVLKGYLNPLPECMSAVPTFRSNRDSASDGVMQL
ncbi:MAG: hypothetical protein Q9213_003692 [Squamulea squamosa]